MAVIAHSGESLCSCPADTQRHLPLWCFFDSAAISASIVVAAALRFWRLGIPAEPVYDETKVLRQAQSFLHGWMPPYSSHPPGGKLLVAISIYLFGNCPWGWRTANALMGTGLVAISYLLTRRLFRSRVAGAIGALLLLCEGMFLVASRVAMINIAYVAWGAAAFLALWCFVQSSDPKARRIYLVIMSVFLGLCMVTKAVISEVTVLLALAIVVSVLLPARSIPLRASLLNRRLIGTVGLVGAIVSLFYLGVFLPYYRLRWTGIGDLLAYHRRVVDYNLELPTSFPDSSPFWSWPLLLHPYAYWRKEMLDGTVATLWCGGNPLLWWAVLPAVLIAVTRAYSDKNRAWLFLAAGYSAYLLMWLPIRRYLFIYSYMPALYLGLLALAGSLDLCWKKNAHRWEQLALLAPVLACMLLGMGLIGGSFAVGATLFAYFLLMRTGRGTEARFVCLMCLSGALVLFVYFFPLWTAIPLSQAGYATRMWLHGNGVAIWI